MRVGFWDNGNLVNMKACRMSGKKLSLINIGDCVFIDNTYYRVIDKTYYIDFNEMRFVVDRMYKDI